MIGFRFRGRVSPPPGEWEAWQGDSEKRFRVEDIDGVTCRRTNFDLGGDQRADAFERPTSLRIAIESRDQLDVNTTIRTET
jgi:hypothetical protein